ncbi:unnamed protein product [Nippostrongylus brasiliensis]|uniref:Secreted protein n=1 Tax=Nippostrongylus brasiliensis TaxID=27835 RepID=A0A0N4Y9M9_NIPBR|nr:unnamed protein product [Nippostrongylus brasiliensis]
MHSSLHTSGQQRWYNALGPNSTVTLLRLFSRSLIVVVTKATNAKHTGHPEKVPNDAFFSYKKSMAWQMTTRPGSIRPANRSSAFPHRGMLMYYHAALSLCMPAVSRPNPYPRRRLFITTGVTTVDEKKYRGRESEWRSSVSEIRTSTDWSVGWSALWMAVSTRLRIMPVAWISIILSISVITLSPPCHFNVNFFRCRF